MAARAIQQEYMQIPPITRTYTTACVLTTIAVQIDVITPFQIYFNPELILKHFQVWRLITNFLYFGPIGFNFFFNLIFAYRYCRMLEEVSFHGRTGDFFFMFLVGGSLMILCSFFVNMVFLGSALTIMLVYVWSRLNPFVRMNFFGFVNFHAPYLPWVLLAFSMLLGNSIIIDVMGITVGHVYYFLEHIYPSQPGGFRLLKTPNFINYLFDGHQDNPNIATQPEDRPGGFDWGGREQGEEDD